MHNVWRIIDANLNRASEGLRVIEEVARFIMEDEKLTGELKQCRHRLAEVCRHPAFRYYDLVAARDSEGDVGGARTYSQSEGRRSDYKEIAVANMKRVQEAARTLEEFGKLISAEVGYGFKQFRFYTYTMEKSFVMALRRWERPVASWDLSVITGDDLFQGRSADEVVSRIIAGGAGVIQLSAKEVPVKDLVATGKRIRETTRKAAVHFIVSDRVDVALAVDADGVHIGRDAMRIEDVRKLLGFQKLIGVSVHNVAEALLAEREGADYVSIGPIFAIGTNKDTPSSAGVQMIRAIRKAVHISCVAMGGINHDNVAEVIRAGADGAAIHTAIIAADDVQEAAASIKQIIRNTKENREGNKG